MKKRKELNALIGLGGGSGERGSGSGGSNGRKKRHSRKGSASGHRLLRTESAESSSSSSSDPDYGDGFGLPGARSCFAKGDYLRCCKLCYPLCAFVILTACVVVCAGLVWMQVALKEDLDDLKERFRTMESNQKTSFQEFPRLTEDLLGKQRQLEQLKSGDMGLNKIWLNITEINKQISLLMSAVNHLKGNMKSASDLINLPITVEELQKSVATIGSTVTSVHHDVETMQATIEEHKRTIELLQNQMNEHAKDGGKQLPLVSASPVPQISEKNLTDSCKQDNQYLHTSLEEVNSTLVVYQKLNDLKLFSMDSTISNLSWRVASLENHMVVVDKLERKENLTLSMVGDITTSANVENEHEPRNESTAEKAQNMEKTENGESQVSKLREKLQLINALSSKPENDRMEASQKGKPQSTTSQPTKLPRLYSISLGSSVEGNRQPRDLSLPGISNIEDLQDLFKTTNEGKLSYEELESLLGPTEHNSQSFKAFDADGDEKYSLPELRVALGV